ncbi:ATP-binding cassette subfamily B protein [Bacillus mesophilus]|uniref:ABC transporter ATP-binding protein n=1 Tax=Bacillus mesophilus TaxID=1808955 RepID=A0A6M0QDR2_9BACI|nr:ABC transporter ATP-binding protein [Bacillus mesophilus]MBM7662669.1 ATP-binding cassette subfamily B protein [Bacillus mesophilus]NEY73268.1 ABC transporter ATP-binding protein [Bacillus mesophilus]
MFKELTKPFKYKKIALNQDQQTTPSKKKPRAKNWGGTIKRIWRYLSEQKGLLSLVLIMVVISSGLGLLGPFLIGVAIDDYIVNRDPNGFITLLVSLICVYIFFSISLWLQNVWMIGIAQKTVERMRNQLFRHLHRLPIPFFDKRQHGELMSRITNDIENVSSTLNSSVIQIFSSVLTLVGTISVMIYLSPLLTLITLTIIPAMFLGIRWITNRTGSLFKETQKNLGNLNGYIEETVSGQRIVKTFSREEKVMAEFIEKSERLKGSAFWAQTFTGFIPKVMNVLNNLSFAIIAGVGGIFALNGMISIGAIVIFAEYSRQFTRPLNDLANQFNTLLSAVAGAERVFEILDHEEEENDEQNAGELSTVNGEVEFKNASFSYEKGEDTVSGLTFHVQPGQSVALVGPTGAGKTTVINLLSRFYELDQGMILIDGNEISSIKRSNLRKHMGFVLQDSFLFEGTVLENIRYGRLDATDEEVIEAAKLANAHSFIKKLPNQYMMKLKQDGSGISQGQRQLLSIARAILADPTILILDEATSSIDTITEMKIQEALQRLMEGRTSFVIAHRLNTIQNADIILVLKEGKIIEKGTHEELLNSHGFYYEMYHSKVEDDAV